MEILLTKPELEQFIDEQVKAGNFESAAEVVEAALSRLMLDPLPDEGDEETSAAIERADGEFDRGEDRPFAAAAAELRAKFLGR